MRITRRIFITLFGASALSTFAYSSGKKPAGDIGGSMTLGKSAFVGLVGSGFLVRAEDGTAVNARLLEVTEHSFPRHYDAPKSSQSYSLLFRSIDGNRIAEGNHRFYSRSAGELSFFAAPVTSDPDLFEVCVNRI